MVSIRALLFASLGAALLTASFYSVADELAPNKGGLYGDVRYAYAPEFWYDVEQILRNELEQVVSADDNPEPRNRLKMALNALTKLEHVPLPLLDQFKRVRLLSGGSEYYRMAFLVREDANYWCVLTNNLTQQRVRRDGRTRLQELDFRDELLAIRRMAVHLTTSNEPPSEMMVKSVKQFGSLAYEPREFTGRPDGADYLRMAYLARAYDKDYDILPLILAAVRPGKVNLDVVRTTYATNLYNSAIADLKHGAPRSEIADRLQFVVENFDDDIRSDEAAEYVPVLLEMSHEDATYAAPLDVNRRSTAEQVAYWRRALRDCSVVQQSQPGYCWIPGWQHPPLRSALSSESNPAEGMIQLGYDAVPDLIAALSDRRLTRSYGYHRIWSLWHVLRVQDAALQCLEVIAHSHFYRGFNSDSYFSRETSEQRAEIVKNIKAWWRYAQRQDEREDLRQILAEDSGDRISYGLPGAGSPNPHRLLIRLYILEGKNALPDVWGWASSQRRGVDYAYRMILAWGDDQDRARIEALADPYSRDFSYPALGSLRMAELIDDAEYQQAVFDGSMNLCRRKDRGPGYVRLLSAVDRPEAKVLAAACWRASGREVDYISSTGDAESDRRVVSQLLPLLTDPEGPTIAFLYAGNLLGIPPGKDEWGPIGNNDYGPSDGYRRRLLETCRKRGIEAATTYPWEDAQE